MYAANEFGVTDVGYRFGTGAHLRFNIPQEQEKAFAAKLSESINLGNIIESLESFGKGFKLYNEKLNPKGAPVVVAMRRPQDGAHGNTSVVIVPANARGANIVFTDIAGRLGLDEVIESYQANLRQIN